MYDTLEPEQNLDDVEEVMSADPGELGSQRDHVLLQVESRDWRSIWRNTPRDSAGILKSAYEKGVPVFVPAFTDSELGLDVALNNRLRESTGTAQATLRSV